MLHAKDTLEQEKKDIMAKKTGLEEELRVKQEILMETKVCVYVFECVCTCKYACVCKAFCPGERTLPEQCHSGSSLNIINQPNNAVSTAGTYM